MFQLWDDVLEIRDFNASRMSWALACSTASRSTFRTMPKDNAMKWIKSWHLKLLRPHLILLGLIAFLTMPESFQIFRGSQSGGLNASAVGIELPASARIARFDFQQKGMKDGERSMASGRWRKSLEQRAVPISKGGWYSIFVTLTSDQARLVYGQSQTV